MRNLSRFSVPAASVTFGVIAWLTYGVIELCCLAVLPRLVETGYEYREYAVGFSILCLAVYAVCGALAGVAIGYLLPAFAGNKTREIAGPDGRCWRAVHTMALTAVLLGSLVLTWGGWQFSPVLLAISLGAVLILSAGAMGEGAFARRCGRFTAAWVPSCCYLLSLWVADLSRNSGASAQRTNVYVGFIIVAIVILGWCLTKPGTAGAAIPKQALAGVLGIAILACSATGLLHPSPYRVSAKQALPTGPLPNVILIVMDTVRADHLSVYGYQRNTTPELKRLAGESTLFMRSISSSDMSLPSHASMFTGLYASLHGAHFSSKHRLGNRLDPNVRTLAEILSAHGFWSAGVVSNGGYLSASFGLQRGFSYWDQRLPAVVLAPLPDPYLRSRIRNLAVRFLPTSERDRVSRSAATINEAALDAVARRPKDRPMFLFLNYMDAHVPYIPPAPYDTMFPGKDSRFTEARYLAAYRNVVSGNHAIEPSIREHLISQYDGAIAYLDNQLGVLFDRLKGLGVYDNSLIIVTSDHGEAHGERNTMDHGGLSLYEEQIHVPLIVKYPNSRRSAVDDEPAGSVDLLPTVLDVAGLPAVSGLSGMSLVSSARKERQYVISESFPGGRAFFANQTRFGRSYRSVISPSLKYIAGSSGKPELYNIPKDPAESRNLFSATDHQSQIFAARLNAWSRSITQQPRGPTKVDANAIERLRSLGYVQ